MASMCNYLVAEPDRGAEMPEPRHTVKREVTLHADREDVWRALTDPELAEQWLADEVELELREGGEVVFRYDDRPERRGHVREVHDEERLSITWRRDAQPESDVEFVLADAAAGTRLVVVESRRAGGPVGSSGWDERLFSLEVLALVRGATHVRAAGPLVAA
jgi:uncharacterized protein YndB with AHSA1/START domain